MSKVGFAQHPFRLMLQPLTVGSVTLRNRVVMGSMHTGLEVNNESEPYKRLAAFYAERAKGQVGLIITGGFAPNTEGLLSPHDVVLETVKQAKELRRVTDAVHSHDGKIILQMLHAGRYGRNNVTVSASNVPSPVFNARPPMAMTHDMIKHTIDDYVRLASLAREAHFDGVEIMASEGYLLNQFIAPRTNKRTDEYGGCLENRIRFPLEVLRAVRAIAPNPRKVTNNKKEDNDSISKNETQNKCGGSVHETTANPFLVIFRLSVLDLVPDGSTQAEVIELAQHVAESGADIINTGIGWHESRVPTIATSVPRGGFSWATHSIKSSLRSKNYNTPVIAVNRVNKPEVLEQVIAHGDADLVAMARPFLTDAEFVQKVIENKPESINVCIACNEACLDHIFAGKVASCMLNPEACHETIRPVVPLAHYKNNNNNKNSEDNFTEQNSNVNTSQKIKRIAVIGGGPAGASCAITLARRGHTVTLFEKNSTLGGQFNLAKRIPGKEEFQSAIDYWNYTLHSLPNVHVKLNTETTPEMLYCAKERDSTQSSNNSNFDEIVVATGCEPRSRDESGIIGLASLSNVFDYTTALMHPELIGKTVSIIGAGGIGYDMAEFLASRTDGTFTPLTQEENCYKPFLDKWNIDETVRVPGGLLNTSKQKTSKNEVNNKQRANNSTTKARSSTSSPEKTAERTIYMFQRSRAKFGAHLGPTTGWIHRLEIIRHGVQTIGGVEYKSFDGKTLVYVQDGNVHELAIDSLVLCTGQKSNDAFLHSLTSLTDSAMPKPAVHGVGGCVFTKRLDAVKAILHAHELAIKL